MHLPVHFLPQNSEVSPIVMLNIALCSPSRVCCLLDALMVPLHFGRCLKSFWWLKRTGRSAASYWYTLMMWRTWCCWCLFVTPVTWNKLVMRWRYSSHLEKGPSVVWRRSTSKSWRASMFIVYWWRIKRNMSHKILLGHATSVLDDSFPLHPLWFVLSCRVSFAAGNLGPSFGIVQQTGDNLRDFLSMCIIGFCCYVLKQCDPPSGLGYRTYCAVLYNCMLCWAHT